METAIVATESPIVSTPIMNCPQEVSPIQPELPELRTQLETIVTQEVSPVQPKTPVILVAKPQRAPRKPVAVVVAPVKPVRTKPVPAKKGRGRPNVYTGKLLDLMVAMIKACENSSLVRAVLTSPNKGKSEYTTMRKSLADSCEMLQLSAPMTISLPMLGKYAAEAGIVMTKGRPSFDSQAKQLQKLNAFVERKAKLAATRLAKSEPVKAVA
jgi:hypothetical protein